MKRNAELKWPYSTLGPEKESKDRPTEVYEEKSACNEES